MSVTRLLLLLGFSLSVRVVSDSEVHKADKVRLVGEIYDELDEVRLIMMRFVRSERPMIDDKLDDDCEVCPADE